MLNSIPAARTEFADQLVELFYQRTLICLWLAAIFFSLFSILDFIVCRPFFQLFLVYRLVYVSIILGFIHMLDLQAFRRHAPLMMYIAMVLGTITISLMTVRLGGFSSGYYVGILLMIAGGISVLPLTTGQALFTGMSMYVVYMATIFIGVGKAGDQQLLYAANNSFFFLLIVWVTTVQSYDDLQTHLRELRMRKSIRELRQELTLYTDDLEATIQQRLAALEESNLKYRDLYNSMLDLVVLTDERGIIRRINELCVSLLGREPEELVGKDIQAVMLPTMGEEDGIAEILPLLAGGKSIRGRQLKLHVSQGQALEIELSANHVTVDDSSQFLFILRDISARKKMERDLLDSERLLDTSRQSAIFGLARLAECRDTDTGAHLSRIQYYTLILSKELAKSKEFDGVVDHKFIEDILQSCVLHDIGKVGIPDSILLKPGKLTQGEYEQMKLHCKFGSETLLAAQRQTEHLSFLDIGREIARSHHERWDGKGYPDGLAGKAIPLAARIVSVADVYDAMTSKRVYKPAYSHGEVREMIMRESGRQFDPQIVQAFLRTEPQFREILRRQGQDHLSPLGAETITEP